MSRKTDGFGHLPDTSVFIMKTKQQAYQKMKKSRFDFSEKASEK